jgi:hypothetical protein
VVHVGHERLAGPDVGVRVVVVDGVAVVDVQAGIDDVVCDLGVLLEWVEREEAAGEGEAPYPPNFPKMPGEPPRVQPSRAKKTEA